MSISQWIRFTKNWSFNHINNHSRYFLEQIQQWEHQSNVWNLFKINNKDTRTTSDVVLVSLLSNLNRFYTLLWCFHCWICSRISGLSWILPINNRTHQLKSLSEETCFTHLVPMFPFILMLPVLVRKWYRTLWEVKSGTKKVDIHSTTQPYIKFEKRKLLNHSIEYKNLDLLWIFFLNNDSLHFVLPISNHWSLLHPKNIIKPEVFHDVFMGYRKRPMA